MNNRQNRTSVVVCDLDQNVPLFVIFGNTFSTPTYNYGTMVAPDSCHNFGIRQPNPGANVHTVNTQVGVVTAGGTASCSYFEKAD